MTTTSIRAALVALALTACAEGPEREPSGSDTPSPSDAVTSWGAEDSAVDDPTPTTAPTDTSTDVQDPPMTGFSFVRDDLAGMPYPHGDDLTWVSEQGVSLVVSLTEASVDPDTVEVLGMELLHLPIEDFHAPTAEQQQAFVREVQLRRDAGETVAVHCLAGLGRTGTMLATWLVAEGLGADEAIDEVRALRPGSIETTEQEDAVRRFARAVEDR